MSVSKVDCTVEKALCEKAEARAAGRRRRRPPLPSRRALARARTMPIVSLARARSSRLMRNRPARDAAMLALQVRGYPTLKSYYAGRELETHQGPRDLQSLKAWTVNSIKKAGK